ncbi:MAG TPA: DUF4350 domain-containing protein [Actinocrinis sp.]|nr:DUF4350 domain-containing protein [Actinocrinis sp.]
MALCAAVSVLAAAAAPMPAHADALPSPSGSVDTSTLLDPTSDSALLNLLGQQGVRYYPVTGVGEVLDHWGPNTTLVIDESEHLDDYDLTRLTSFPFGRVIILDSDPAVITAFAPEIHFDTFADSVPVPLSPACTQADAAAAGAIDLTGSPAQFILNATSGSVAGCYPVNGHPTFAYVRDGSSDVVTLGSATFFENDELASAGNAALALRLFGAKPQLIWLAPSFVPDLSLQNCSGFDCGSGQNGNPGPAPTTTITLGGGGGGGGGGGSGGGNGGGGGGGSGASQQTLTSLMPSWIWWALLQLLLAVLLVAYWRGRRLGAVVTEQLPVTVRAAETVEGHARLYRRANAHGRAAELLRKATASRLAGYFGVPAARAHADPSILVAPVAARLNVTADLIADLLTGQAPESEAELVLLADHLDQLEQEVRSS